MGTLSYNIKRLTAPESACDTPKGLTTYRPFEEVRRMAKSSLPENRFYVYILRRPDKEDPFEPGKGQPFYVGKGSNGRAAVHRLEAKCSLCKPGRKTYKISIIHGLWSQHLDFIEDIVIKNITKDKAFDLEKDLIKAYGRKNNGTGILSNLTDGGEGGAMEGEDNPFYGKNHSEETKQKLREAMKGRPSYIRTKETCHKLSEAKKGHPVSEETRKKLSESHKGKVSWNKGISPSKETRQKLSEALRGRSRGKNSKETREKLSLAAKRQWERYRQARGES